MKLVEEKIRNTDLFLVDVKVKPSNKIEVFLDALKGVKIENCIEINRFLEGSLDREKEDFDLTVSSAGLDEPFKVPMQYTKNLGKQVALIKKSGEKVVGVLSAFENETVVIETRRTERKAAGKGKQFVVEPLTIPMEEIKETKIELSF